MTPPASGMQQPRRTGWRWGAARTAAAACGLVFLTACAATTPSPNSPATVAGPTGEPTAQAAGTSPVSATNTAPAPSPSATPPPDSTSGRVEIVLPKDEYALGEGVEYTFTNHFNRPIYFRYGSCDFPFIYQRADGEAFILVTNILDYEPNVTELAAGDSLRCVWDQTVWAISSDPVDYDPEPQDLQDHRYYIALDYAFTEEGADVADALRKARSDDFWIR